MEKESSVVDNLKKEMENVEFNDSIGMQLEGNFTDMRISDIGFGKDEYKSSKPNIVRNDGVINEILNISEAAETAIGHTIGPYADATLIQQFADREVPVFNTRDGFTILQNMKYSQPIPNAIFKTIREASEYMQMEVGDSTSSGIPIQNALLKKFVEIFNDQSKGVWKYSPVGIRNISTIASERIIRELNHHSKYQVTFPRVNAVGKYDNKDDEEKVIEWLTKVATISANNDMETGKKIAELYRNKLDGRGSVIVTESKTEEEYYEETNAFIVPTGPLDEARMCNSADHFTWEADKPLIAMFDGSILETDLPAFKQIVETVAFDFNRPLYVVASNFNYEIAQYMRQCIDGTYYNEFGQELNSPEADPSARTRKISICASLLKNQFITEQFRFEDLLLMTNSRAFSTELTKMSEFSKDRNVRMEQLKNLLGTCEHISCGRGETNFIGCEPNKEAFDALITDLKNRAEKLKRIKFHRTDYDEDDLFNRIDNLQARTTYYYCGGRTLKAKYSRKLIIEDATSSVAAAIKSGGVSIGGNMAICHYIEHNFDYLVERIIEDIYNVKINITAAQNFTSLREIVSIILQAIQYSFGNAYRYALYNMYRDSKIAMEKWVSCIKRDRPTIYNIMTNMDEVFDSTSPSNSTSIMVPRNTDSALLRVIIESVGELINVGNMISLMPPNVDVEALQLKQLETGAAYMASASFTRQ